MPDLVSEAGAEAQGGGLEVGSGRAWVSSVTDD